MTDENNVVNAEDFGFTADDLKDVEVQVTDDVETAESTDSESSTDTPLNSEQETTVTDDAEETSNGSSDDTENHGDLNKALAAERKRRKEAEKKLNEYRQQTAPVSLSADEVSNINQFAKETAMKQLGIDNVEDIMYTEPEKYAQLMEVQGQIKYIVTQQQQERLVMRNQNIAFINSIQSMPDFNELYAMAEDELNSMTRAESNPIDEAFARTGNGVGTQQDFDVINKFVERLRNKRNEQSLQQSSMQSNPLDKAKDLPKAGALGGGNGKALANVSQEELMKMVAEGRESELPITLQKQLKELIG